MNIWKEMTKDQVKPELFPVLVTISKGSSKKYQFVKEYGVLKLEKVLYSATCYPVNCGIIPRTLGKDGRPLEVLVLCQEVLDLHTIVECSPIGVIKTYENNIESEKIIAVPVISMTYGFDTPVGDELLESVYQELKPFFNIYSAKNEPGFREQAEGIGAVLAVEECMERFDDVYDTVK